MKKLLSIILALMMIIGLMPVATFAADNISNYTIFTFNEDGTVKVVDKSTGKFSITAYGADGEEDKTDDAVIKSPIPEVNGLVRLAKNFLNMLGGTEDLSGIYSAKTGDNLFVEISRKEEGNFVFQGKASDIGIIVKKAKSNESEEDLNFYLNGLTLSSSFTAPILIKTDENSTEKTITIHLMEGTINTLSDAELNNEDNNPGNLFAESAVIKAKSGNHLVFTGNGKLIIGGESGVDNNSASHNGIKTGVGGKLDFQGGTYDIKAVNDAIHSDVLKAEYDKDVLKSMTEEIAEEIKAHIGLSIAKGNFIIDCGDDAIHSGTSMVIGSSITNQSEADTINNDVEINITNCNEGIEANYITINSGNISLKSIDDGINASDGLDAGDFTMGRQAYCDLVVNGGNIFVDAGCDGIDSNASIHLNGGNLIVFGCSSAGMDQPIDYGSEHGGEFIINGATVFSAGSKSLIINPSINSKQPYIRQSLSSALPTGTDVKAIYKNGKTVTYTTVKSVNCLFYSAPDMKASSDCSFNTQNTQPGGLPTIDISSFFSSGDNNIVLQVLQMISGSGNLTSGLF